MIATIPPEPFPSNRKRFARLCLFTVGCAVIVVMLGSWRVPAGVPRGVEYVLPTKFSKAAKRGTIDLKNFGDDDMGYPLLLQAWVLIGGGSTFETIAELHNVFVLICCVAFATASVWMTRSVLAGWLSLAFALVLIHTLRGILFGALDNRTLIVCFPLAFAFLLVLVGPVTRRIHLPLGILSALGMGAVIQMADFVRHSEGILAFLGIVVACLLVQAPLWRRAATVAIVLLGSGLVMHAVPNGVRLFNDIRTGSYEQGIDPYHLPTTGPSYPYHGVWHTIQTALGRYSNPEGLYYNDYSGRLTAAQTYPELAENAGPDKAARAYYLWYVRTHPLDWFRALARGALEVFYFIPYATSVGSYPWALGYLPAKEGVIPQLIADPRDVPYDLSIYPWLRGVGYGSLLNLRMRYLKLTLVEWAVFIGSLVCVPMAIWVASVAGDVENRRVFVSLLVYVGLGAGVRAVIPTYGQSLLVAHWGASILAAIYVLHFACRSGAIGITPGARIIRWFNICQRPMRV